MHNLVFCYAWQLLRIPMAIMEQLENPMPPKRRHAPPRLGPLRVNSSWRPYLLFAVLCVAFAFPLWGHVRAAPQFPPLTGRIVDNANLIKPEDRAAIEADLEALAAKSSDQLVVLTTKSLQGYPIADFGYQLGRFWGIGQKGTNNGVILIVAPAEHAVRIEVGRGLEPVLTDLLSTLILQNAILPKFKQGDFSGGIRAGVRDIKDTLLGDAEAVKQRAAAYQATVRRANPGGEWATLVFIVIIFLIVFFFQARQAAQSPRGYRRYGDGAPIFFPGGWGGYGGWRGGEGGGGGRGGDGGGFSGGGGDFGGGGASGSW